MFEIKMPKAGQSMEEGTIVKWCKSVGDNVKVGEVLFEVETDKATIEVESTHEGVLSEIRVPEGSTVPVHQVVAIVGGSSKAADSQAKVEPVAPAPEPQTVAVPQGVTPILMPKAGQSVEEAQILAWKVNIGDKIKPGDVIFEVETDKASIEVEATDAGRVARIVAQAGDVVKVLEPVAYLGDDDAAVDAFIASASAAQAPMPLKQVAPALAPAAPVFAASTSSSGRVKASPAARKIAVQRGIDLSTIPAGKGPGGRILSTDVPASAPAPAATCAGGARRRMSPMRKAIARNLTCSKQTIPHFYMRLTVDAQPMMAFYRSQKALYPCSVNDVVTKAAARAVSEFPAMRSRIDNEEIIEYPQSNIGLAVGMDDGLVVPVVVGAESMSLRELASQSRRLADLARGGKIEGMGKGVMTITNLGMFGVEEFAAIINPPESAILAVGAVREDVVVSDGAIKAGKVMTLTLSADHRLVDGLLAAKFMARLKELLLAPESLV
jgi:pyruvate dehydrogenase E2 component (dihydrolipoamide acetyltransferase)